MSLRSTLILALLMSGCATTPPVVTHNAPLAARAYQEGNLVAARLSERYHYAPPDCGEDSKPAFLCSGVIFRATHYSPAYDAWNPSPPSVVSGGVSFSYLRKDAKFNTMLPGQHNGYILHPVLNRPFGKRNLEVLCYFPIDADTDQREKPGCGEHKNFPTVSRSCELQSIQTAEQWQQHYSQTQLKRESQCGFNVSDERNTEAGPVFNEAMRTHNLGSTIPEHLFMMPNEFRIATWPQNIPLELPIEAFFYVDATGLIDAKKDRDSFQAKTSIRLPLIKITLPANRQQDALFDYRPEDNN